MKKSGLFILFVLVICSTKAQTFEMNRVYHTYRGENGVVSFYIPGFICRFACAVADLDPGEEELLQSIRSIKILTIENPDLNSRVNFAKEIHSGKLKEGYHKLLEVHDPNEDVLIIAREKDNCIRELAIVVGGKNNTLIVIRGRMNRDLLHALSDVTGINELDHTRKLLSSEVSEQ